MKLIQFFVAAVFVALASASAVLCLKYTHAVGGQFTALNPVYSPSLAYWNGAQWEANIMKYKPPVDSIEQLVVISNVLYIAGPRGNIRRVYKFVEPCNWIPLGQYWKNGASINSMVGSPDARYLFVSGNLNGYYGEDSNIEYSNTMRIDLTETGADFQNATSNDTQRPIFKQMFFWKNNFFGVSTSGYLYSVSNNDYVRYQNIVGNDFLQGQFNSINQVFIRSDAVYMHGNFYTTNSVSPGIPEYAACFVKSAADNLNTWDKLTTNQTLCQFLNSFVALDDGKALIRSSRDLDPFCPANTYCELQGNSATMVTRRRGQFNSAPSVSYNPSTKQVAFYGSFTNYRYRNYSDNSAFDPDTEYISFYRRFNNLATLDTVRDVAPLFGGGVDGTVTDIYYNGATAYVVGSFSYAYNTYSAGAAAFDRDSAKWVPVGPGHDNTSYTITSVLIDDADSVSVFIGGQFPTVNYNQTVNSIYKVDALNNAIALGAGLSVYQYSMPYRKFEAPGTVFDMIKYRDFLIVGGSFDHSGATPLNNLAKYDTITGQWSDLGCGVDGTVYALHRDGDLLYVGGSFRKAGNLIANNIAVLDLSTEKWSTLNTGVDNTVFDITDFDGDIYIAGAFNKASGIFTPDKIAAWNGKNFVHLNASGYSPSVAYHLHKKGDMLYISSDYVFSYDGKAIVKDPLTLGASQSGSSGYLLLNEGPSAGVKKGVNGLIILNGDSNDPDNHLDSFRIYDTNSGNYLTHDFGFNSYVTAVTGSGAALAARILAIAAVAAMSTIFALLL